MRREAMEFIDTLVFGGVYAGLSCLKRRANCAGGAFRKGVCHPSDERMDELREANIEWVRFDIGGRPLDENGQETEGYRAFKERAASYRKAGYQVMAVTPYPEQYSKEPFSPTDAEYRKRIVGDAVYMAKDLQGIVSAFQIANELQLSSFRFPLTEEQSVEYLGIQLEALNESKGDIAVGFNLLGLTPVKYMRAMRRYIKFCDYVGVDVYLGCFEPIIKEISFFDFVIRLVWAYTGKPVCVNEFGYIGKGRPKTKEERKRILLECGFETETAARAKVYELIGRLPERFALHLSKYVEQDSPEKLAGKLFDTEMRHHLYRDMPERVKLREYDHTPEGQARFMTDVIGRLRRLPMVCGAFVYCYQDNGVCWCGQEDCPVETGWGLLDRNGNKKPAWYAVRDAFR